MKEVRESMAIDLDEAAVRERLRPLTQSPRFLRAVENVTADPLFLSLFLMGVSFGEALGEKGVAAIREDEVARQMHDLERQRLEEHGHAGGARLIVEELFPEHFDAGRYRYEESLFNREYYFTVREENRRRLKEQGRYSRLNLYLTTSFGYEVMVELLYGAVLGALRRSPLPRQVRERVELVLTMILRQEETHLGIVAQHNRLLGIGRSGLSPRGAATLDALALVQVEDYGWAANLAVREIVRAYAPYAEAATVRAYLESARAAG
jgi:hypothetical protein